jgi:hypothetical protein
MRGAKVLPLFLEHYAAVIWEDQDECPRGPPRGHRICDAMRASEPWSSRRQESSDSLRGLVFEMFESAIRDCVGPRRFARFAESQFCNLHFAICIFHFDGPMKRALRWIIGHCSRALLLLCVRPFLCSAIRSSA